MTHGEPNEHSLRSVRHLLHPQECLRPRPRPCVRVHTHLSRLDVRFVDRLRVRLNDLLHVEDVVFFNVLEFLWNGESYGTVVKQIMWNHINGMSPWIMVSDSFIQTRKQKKTKHNIGNVTSLFCARHFLCVCMVYDSHTPPVRRELFCSWHSLTGVLKQSSAEPDLNY